MLTRTAFDFSTPVGCAKKLIFEAVTCSAKMNLALELLGNEGFVPLSDANPYSDLLSAKHRRAIAAIRRESHDIQLTDLSFAVFENLANVERLQKMKISEVVAYRTQSAPAREAFLEYLSVLQTKHGVVGTDYAADITKVVMTEIVPAARAFRNKLESIDGALYGTVAKGIVGGLLAGPASLSIFGDLSWPKLLALSGGVAAYLGNALIDDYFAQRAARRECAVSYVLSLDE